MTREMQMIFQFGFKKGAEERLALKPTVGERGIMIKMMNERIK